MTMPTQLIRVAPTLATYHIDRILMFYQTQLGFQLDFRYDGYAAVSRLGVQIHFWQCDDQTIVESNGCYVYVENIAPLYEEYQARGIIHPNGALAIKPWGVNEFVVLTPDQNLIKFGEIIR